MPWRADPPSQTPRPSACSSPDVHVALFEHGIKSQEENVPVLARE